MPKHSVTAKEKKKKQKERKNEYSVLVLGTYLRKTAQPSFFDLHASFFNLAPQGERKNYYHLFVIII